MPHEIIIRASVPIGFFLGRPTRQESLSRFRSLPGRDRKGTQGVVLRSIGDSQGIRIPFVVASAVHRAARSTLLPARPRSERMSHAEIQTHSMKDESLDAFQFKKEDSQWRVQLNF
jgi:hypothetical protein